MRLASIFHRGLFLQETFQIPEDGKTGLVEESCDIRPSDIVSDSITFKNTEYKRNMLVVLEVINQDRIIAGWIRKVVVREKKVFFLLSSRTCRRTALRYFESVEGKAQIELKNIESLRSFKPLIPQGKQFSYVFFLHGKLIDDFTG
jgi:hypothetical protein